jgi:hypothetical protein
MFVSGFSSLAQTQPAVRSRTGNQPCSLLGGTPSQIKASAPADLQRAYNAQAHMFRSIHLVGTMHSSSTQDGSNGGKRRELGAIIDLQQPDMIRINGVVPYAGSRVVELTSDGRNFGLLVPSGDTKLYYFGPVDAPARSQNPWENLRPGPFLLALRWEEGTMQTLPQQAETDPASATLVIDVPGHANAGPHQVRAQFDLSKGVVDLLTVYDGAGSPLFQTHYSDWRTTANSSSSVPDDCYPRQILMVDNRHGYEVNIHINDVTLNMETPRSLFRPSPPRGVPIKRLDGFGG